jgi:hypothetical protein
MLPRIESSNPRASEQTNFPIFADSYNETRHVTQGAEPFKKNSEVGMRNAENKKGNAELIEFGSRKSECGIN